MKLSQIAALCAKTKRIKLIDDKETQWAGDGAGMYALTGLPEFDEETIVNAFGIDAKKKDEYMLFREQKSDSINTDVYDEEDEGAVMFKGESITLGDITLVPVEAYGKIFFIREKYLKPIKFNEETRVVARKKKGTEITYFVITDGMFPIAVIMPMKIEWERCKWMKLLLSSVQ